MSLDDPAEYILETLHDIDGISMGYRTIHLILGYYNDFKYNMLLNGFTLRERNIGTLVPSFRHVASPFREGGPKPGIYVNLKLDPDLERAMLSRFVNSGEVRDRYYMSKENRLALTDGALETMREDLTSGRS